MFRNVEDRNIPKQTEKTVRSFGRDSTNPKQGNVEDSLFGFWVTTSVTFLGVEVSLSIAWKSFTQIWLYSSLEIDSMILFPNIKSLALIMGMVDNYVCAYEQELCRDMQTSCKSRCGMDAQKKDVWTSWLVVFAFPRSPETNFLTVDTVAATNDMIRFFFSIQETHRTWQKTPCAKQLS